MMWTFLIISLIGRYIIRQIKKIDFVIVNKKFNDKYTHDNKRRVMSNFAWKIPILIIPVLDFVFSLLLLSAVFNMILKNVGFQEAVLFGLALISVKLTKRP